MESGISNFSVATGVNLSDMVDTVQIDVFCQDLANNSDSVNATQCDKRVSMVSPVCMFITGVLGNILALTVLHTTRRELRKSPYFVLLLGLAWSDIFSQLMTTPVTMSVYANNLQWQGGKPVCVYSAFMMIGFGMILPLLVCSLSIERLLALRFTYLYSRVVTVSKAKGVVVLCWVFVLVFSTLPLVGFGSYEHQYPGTWCFLNFHNESKVDSAYAFLFAIINVAVILVIVVCNVTVVVTLIKMRKARRHNNSPSAEGRFDHPKKSLLQMEMEIQMVWFLCAVTVVFVTCWLPLNVHIIINLTTGEVNYEADLRTIRLASINQILDPWLYILLRKSVLLKVSKSIGKLLSCPRKNIRCTAAEGCRVQNCPCRHNSTLQMKRYGTAFSSGIAKELPLVDCHSEPFYTCERNDKERNAIVTTRGDYDSSDSDVFLDSNSSKCFPSVYDPEKHRATQGRFPFTNRQSSTGDNFSQKKLRRMFSLPVDIIT